MDIWVRPQPGNAERLVATLKEFGFNLPEISPELFLTDRIVRMGVPPFRIELMSTISGLTFDACYPNSSLTTIDGIEVRIISLGDLKANKRAAGRHKDLDDLEHLP